MLLLAGTACAAEPRVVAHTGRATEVRATNDSIRIPSGTFAFGASDEDQHVALELCRRDLGSMDKACTEELFRSEGPQQAVFLPAFHIDRIEVTVGDYRRCVRTGRCDPRPLLDGDPRFGDPKLPVTRASWFDAQTYCRWVGGDLPTEQQWERAARGTAARIFPWGDAPRDGNSNHGRFVVIDPTGPYAHPMVRIDERDGTAFLSPPGAYPAGTSQEGVADLAGNAMEWVLDRVGDDGPSRAGGSQIEAGARRMLRGGSFRQPLLYQRTTAWEAAQPELRSAEVGFRCAGEHAIERR